MKRLRINIAGIILVIGGVFAIVTESGFCWGSNPSSNGSLSSVMDISSPGIVSVGSVKSTAGAKSKENIRAASLTHNADVAQISFDEMVSVNSGVKDSAVYNVKGTDIYVIAVDSKLLWEETFERMCVFVEGIYTEENNGLYPQGKILSKLEASELGFSYLVGGIDFAMSDVAAFFNAAAGEDNAGNSRLLPQEEQLLASLLNLGLLKQDNGQYRSTKDAAIISVGKFMRMWGEKGYNAHFDHEFNHGVYFLNSDFRAAVHREWNSLSANEQELVKDELGYPYNLFDESILETEYAAYSCTDWNTLAEEDYNIEHARRLKSLYEAYKKEISDRP